MSLYYKNLLYLEGGVFSPLKILIKIHRGLSKNLKLKIVDDYLVSPEKVNIRGRILNFFTNNYQFDY